MFGTSPYEQFGAAVAAAAGEDRSGWSGRARSAAVLELLGARERLDAVILAVTGEWDRDKAWALDGARSASSWLAHRAPLTRQDAAVLVRSARHVARYDKTAKALDAGDITAAHVELAARAAKNREEFYPDHEDVILDAARALNPSGFRKAMEHWRACADAVSDHNDTNDTNDRQHLDAAVTFGGMLHVEGLFEPVGGAALLAVLDAMEPPDPTCGPNPPRTLSQRRAAALIRLACGERPPAVGIDITADIDTFAGRPSPDLTTSCCEIRGYGPVSPALVRTLACDAAIGRVLMRGKSEVLDLGRRTRMITPALRRALEIRDTECVEPGCTIPAAWCDGHHIVHWNRHGPTDIENLELRCRRHHLAQHQHDLETLLERRRT